MSGFHVCVLDFSTPEGVKAATTVDYEPPKRKSRARAGANRSESVKASYVNRPGRAERDAEIIRLYDEMHYSINGISMAMGLDFRTVQKVLHTAANDDKIVLRTNRGGRPRRDAVPA